MVTPVLVWKQRPRRRAEHPCGSMCLTNSRPTFRFQVTIMLPVELSALGQEGSDQARRDAPTMGPVVGAVDSSCSSSHRCPSRLARKLVVSKRGLAIDEMTRSSASTLQPSTAPLSPEQIGALSTRAPSSQAARPCPDGYTGLVSRCSCQFASGGNCNPNEAQRPCS